eukprot:scaffold133349_cov90-Phaeocystis_antarctica.AAC.5
MGTRGYCLHHIQMVAAVIASTTWGCRLPASTERVSESDPVARLRPKSSGDLSSPLTSRRAAPKSLTPWPTPETRRT